MNEHEMSELLHGATRDLTPDVAALVAGGVRRGRRRQRRRTAATLSSSVLAAVVVVVGGSQVVDPARFTLGDVDPAGTPTIAEDPTPTASAPTPAPTGPPVAARLAVTTAEVPTTFASLAPGQVSAPSAKSGPDAAPVVDFTWNGFGIRVGITPDDYVTGRSVPDPARRCADAVGEGVCRPGPDGTIVHTYSAINPPADGGTRVRWAKVFRPDGWDVLVSAYNGPAKEGPAIAEAPPFSLEELERLAGSDTWFR